MRSRKLLAPLALVITLAALTSLPGGAAENMTMRVGHTLSSDQTALFVAADKGFFQKYGLRVETQPIPLNSVIPAALQARSIEAGSVSPPVLLQAVDGGLDLVVITEATIVTRTSTNYAVLARSGSTISKPADFVGKRVGAPGLGAFLHVMFRDWLLTGGVDPEKVTFVEVSFPQMNDVLKGGSVDAVLTADPVTDRIVRAGTGVVVSHYTQGHPGLPVTIFVGRRQWAQDNPTAVAAFRKGYADAVAYLSDHADEARTILGKFVKLPPEALAQIKIPPYSANTSRKGIQDWIEIMKRQKMLQGAVDVSKLWAQ